MDIFNILGEIDSNTDGVFVMHEKSEKRFPQHKHAKGQLSYVDGGIAYITVDNVTHVVPARYFFWIPKGMPHILRLNNSATVIHSLYFYTTDDDSNPFYNELGIYISNNLLTEMINYTEIWSGRMVDHSDDNFIFLKALKKILPTFQNKNLPLQLPFSDNPRMIKIIDYLDIHFGKPLTLKQISEHFNLSERSMSRFFQTELHISFLQYLKTLRMVKAIELLLKTDISISEIANTVGYITLGSFSNTFQEFTGSRPLDMRKTKM